MVNNAIEITPSGSEKMGITLPVSKSDFGDFLGKIIGGKDKLDYHSTDEIHIDSSVILGIESSLLERVESQTHGSIISTRYSVLFSDGKGFKSDSLNKILQLQPSLNINTVSISMEYVFLIYYPNSNEPAREKISIIAQSGVLSFFSVEIEYYNRVFAEECLNRIITVIKSNIYTPKEVTTLRRLKKALGFATIPMVTIVSTSVFIISTYLLRKHANIIFNGQYQDLNIDEKINYIISSTNNYYIAFSTTAFLLIGICAAILPAAALSDNEDTMSRKERRRKITFQIYKSDEVHNKLMTKNHKKRIINFIISGLAAIILSIIAAYLYDLLKA